MNKERAKELLPIIKAFSEGEIIQYKPPGHEWINLLYMDDDITFNGEGEYRIKPEPQKVPPQKVPMGYDDFKDHPIVWTRENGNLAYQALMYARSKIGFTADHNFFQWDSQELLSLEWSLDCINWHKFTKEISE